jgi:putative transcriptional regulator
MKVKNHIKQHRARLDWTQEDLAKKIGISRQSISAIEKGYHHPSILLCLKIADAMGMRLDNLFTLIKD